MELARNAAANREFERFAAEVADPARGTGTIRTTAFTLTRNANGTDTLTINPRVLLYPATLQNDLARYGIPAKVTIGSFCSTDSAPAGFSQVVTFSPMSSSGRISPSQNPTVTIDPTAMPAGTELSFGNFQAGQQPGDGVRAHRHELLHLHQHRTHRRAARARRRRVHPR